jgi:hypothetical protein
MAKEDLMTLENIRPRATALRGDLNTWLRSVAPLLAWTARRRPARAPRVMAALALVGLGAVTALYLAPTSGAELRANTRKGARRVQRRAREMASRARDYQRENGRTTPLERARRNEAASS